MPEPEFHIRAAVKEDIPAMQIVRLGVKENTLSNPALVTDNDVEIYIMPMGRGWVCEISNTLVGYGCLQLRGQGLKNFTS